MADCRYRIRDPPGRPLLVVPLLVEGGPDFDPGPSPEDTPPQEPGDLALRQDLAVVKLSSAPCLRNQTGEVSGSPRPSSTRGSPSLTAADQVYLKVRLEEGLEGYMRRDHLSADKSSLLPENKIAKILVRIPAKRVMSHARLGSLLVEAPMGAIFYADYQNGDLLRVCLPDGETGWINSSGVLSAPPLSPIPVEDKARQLLVATLLAFGTAPWSRAGPPHGGSARKAPSTSPAY